MNWNREYDEDEGSRNLEENQRIGRDIARNRGRENYQDQYRSSQSYHNRNEGYSPEETHYGSRPDSAYRDQNRINYGDNRHQSRNDWPQQNQRSQYNQPYRGDSDYNRRARDFDNPPERGYHGGTQFWGERELFKEDDYRYRSGNRGTWHTPGTSSDYDNDDRRWDNRHNQNRHQDEGFFDRMGNSIGQAWDNVTNFFDENNNNRNDNNADRNRYRGYESGPRWADESEHNRYEREWRNRQNRQRDWDR